MYVYMYLSLATTSGKQPPLLDTKIFQDKALWLELLINDCLW